MTSTPSSLPEHPLTGTALIGHTSDGTPVVEATISKSGKTASFACPWCVSRGRWPKPVRHTHGADGGPRSSHCRTRGGSYYLVVVGSVAA